MRTLAAKEPWPYLFRPSTPFGSQDVDARHAVGHDEVRGADGTPMSELDKVFDELAQKRAQQDEERRERLKVAVAFLTEFYEADIKPSQTLKSRGIEAHFVDNKLFLHKPQSGEYQEPLYIVVGEQGEIDIAGRSLGRYQPAEKLAKKRELIGEIISFFDL
ncbi:MAG: hypothetical protein WBD23_05795 [Candidatus Acidiferrales bacterium]